MGMIQPHLRLIVAIWQISRNVTTDMYHKDYKKTIWNVLIMISSLVYKSISNT